MSPYKRHFALDLLALGAALMGMVFGAGIVLAIWYMVVHS
jgi:hypothetical protein